MGKKSRGRRSGAARGKRKPNDQSTGTSIRPTNTTTTTGSSSSSSSDTIGSDLAQARLWRAMRNGSVVKTMAALDNTDVNRCDSETGISPLYYACGAGNAPIVRELLRAGADPNYECIDDGLPLFAMILNDNIALAKILLHSGRADPNLKTRKCGMTPLYAAASRGGLSAVDLLLKYGADPNLPIETNKNGNFMPLHAAAGNGHLRTVRALISAGADAASPAVDLASHNGHHEIVSVLTNVTVAADGPADGASDRASNDGPADAVTALHIACQNGQLQDIKKLLGGGVDIDAVNDDGSTALHLASQNNHLDIVRFLVAEGADLHVFDKFGMILLHDAAVMGNVEVVTFLISERRLLRVDYPTIYPCPEERSVLLPSVDKHRLRLGEFADGRTPLFFAIYRGHCDVVRELLTAGADPNLPCIDSLILQQQNAGIALADGVSAETQERLLNLLKEHKSDLKDTSNCVCVIA